MALFLETLHKVSINSPCPFSVNILNKTTIAVCYWKKGHFKHAQLGQMEQNAIKYL